MKILSILAVVVGALASLPVLADAEEGYMSLEYGIVTVKPKGGKGKSLPSIRLNMFDTSGALTAGVRGTLNQNAAQKAKEAEIDQAVRNGDSDPSGTSINRTGNSYSASYSYSWIQPAPSPTDGDRWIFTAATDGTPIVDAISTPTSTDKQIASMLGVEYSSALFSHEGDISVAFGWGMKFFIFDSTGGGGIDANSASLPLNITVSTQLMDNVVVYNDFAISPVGLLKRTGFYLHDEIAAHWNFAGDWRLHLTYRYIQDVTDKKDTNGDFAKYQMSDVYLGIAYQF